MRGRKPDPGAPRRGTQHHRPGTDIAPVEISGAIAPEQVPAVPLPRNVPGAKTVKALWRLILSEVARHELRAGDLPLIEAMFTAKVRHAQAGAHIKKHGIMIEQVLYCDDKGNAVTREVVNPMLRVERDQAILYDRLAQRLGLSPESRIRLDLMQIAGASLLDTLRKSLEDVVDEAQDEEIIIGELVEEE